MSLLWLILGFALGLIGAWFWHGPDRWAARRLADAAGRLAEGERRPAISDLWRGSGPKPSNAMRQLAQHVHAYDRRTRDETRRLARQRDDLNALVDALPDPIVQADKGGRLILANRPATELLDVPRDRAMGAPVEAAVSEPAILALFDTVRKIEVGSRDESGKLRLPVRRDVRLSRAGRPLAFQAVATRSRAGGVIVVLRDISSLDAALRMKADFVANAGHELRTPVAAMKLAFETLVDSLDGVAEDVPGATRCLSILDGHLLRMEEMLRDLLDLSRAESPDQPPAIETIAVAELAGELRQALAPAAGEKDVRLDLPLDVPLEFKTDRRLLLLALRNLVENGVKYTGPGGSVSVHVERLRGDAPAGGAVEFQVSDTGKGIPAEHLDRVFERFYQVDAARTGTNARSSGRGTGLGLSIVKHAVQALGGSVSARSVVGKGSTFSVTLPDVRESA